MLSHKSQGHQIYLGREVIASIGTPTGKCVKKKQKFGHFMHGPGALSHLCTPLLHQTMHNMFDQFFASYFQALQRLLNRISYLRAYKIGYNWPQSATVRHNLVLCAPREAQPLPCMLSRCPWGTMEQG